MDVFISYSRKDYQDQEKNPIPNSVIQKIKDKLKEESISYWFDEDGIYVGDQFVNLIAKAIKEADVFVFVSSKNSNSSPWTVSEVATAYHYKKRIIPIRLDDTEYDESIVMFLAALDHMDYFSNPRVELGRMITSIKSYLLEKNNKNKKEQEEKARQQRLKVIDELMSQEYSNKLSIENEIVSHKETLKQLNAQLQEVENSIIELQEEKDKLNGSNKDNKTTHVPIRKQAIKFNHFKDNAYKILSEKKNIVKNVCIICLVALFTIIAVRQCAELKHLNDEKHKLQVITDSIARADSIRAIVVQDSIARANFENNDFLLIRKYERIGSQEIHLYMESSINLDDIENISAEIELEGCYHNMECRNINILGNEINCCLYTSGHDGDCKEIKIKSITIVSSKFGERTLYNFNERYFRLPYGKRKPMFHE